MKKNPLLAAPPPPLAAHSSHVAHSSNSQSTPTRILVHTDPSFVHLCMQPHRPVAHGMPSPRMGGRFRENDSFAFEAWPSHCSTYHETCPYTVYCARTILFSPVLLAQWVGVLKIGILSSGSVSSVCRPSGSELWIFLQGISKEAKPVDVGDI